MTEIQTGVRVQIVRWVEDYQPGIVECVLTDAQGRDWFFIEKLPLVTDEVLDAASAYPRPGVIACAVCDGIVKNSGTVRIDTRHPWQVESVEGETDFQVRADSVTEIDLN